MEAEVSPEKTTDVAHSSPVPPCPTCGGVRVARDLSALGIAKAIITCNTCVERKIEDAGKAAEEKKARELQRQLDAAMKNAAIAPRFKDKTLGNWIAKTPAQKQVMIEVQAFLEAPWECTGLIFSGSPGTGKNHLACAIAKYFILNLRKSALVTTAFKIIRAIKATWNGAGDEGKVLERFADIDLLVIDEIGVQFGSDTEIMYLSEIINDRYEREKPTILISNKTPEEICTYLGDRIIDRFRDGGHILVFDWESHRGKK